MSNIEPATLCSRGTPSIIENNCYDERGLKNFFTSLSKLIKDTTLDSWSTIHVSTLSKKFSWMHITCHGVWSSTPWGTSFTSGSTHFARTSQQSNHVSSKYFHQHIKNHVRCLCKFSKVTVEFQRSQHFEVGSPHFHQGYAIIDQGYLHRWHASQQQNQMSHKKFQRSQ